MSNATIALTAQSIECTFEVLTEALRASPRDYSPEWANGTGYFDGLERTTAPVVQWFSFEDEHGRPAVALQTPLGTVVAFSRYRSGAAATRVVVCAGAQSPELGRLIEDHWVQATGMLIPDGTIWNRVVSTTQDVVDVLDHLNAIESAVRYGLRQLSLAKVRERTGL